MNEREEYYYNKGLKEGFIKGSQEGVNIAAELLSKNAKPREIILPPLRASLPLGEYQHTTEIIGTIFDKEHEELYNKVKEKLGL